MKEIILILLILFIYVTTASAATGSTFEVNNTSNKAISVYAYHYKDYTSYCREPLLGKPVLDSQGECVRKFDTFTRSKWCYGDGYLKRTVQARQHVALKGFDGMGYVCVGEMCYGFLGIYKGWGRVRIASDGSVVKEYGLDGGKAHVQHFPAFRGKHKCWYPD